MSEDFYHDDPIKEISKTKVRSKILTTSALIVGSIFFFQSTLAGNISLNSDRGIEFGQSASQAVACSGETSLTLTPGSIFVNENNAGGSHYLKSVTVSNIPSSCNGVDLSIQAFGVSSSTPFALFNSSATTATVSNANGTFQGGRGSAGLTVNSGSGTFTVNFTNPVALSSSIAKITIQSGVGKPFTTAVSTGGIHTCALLNLSEMKCWGSNSYGALGNGLFLDSAFPVNVTGVSGVASISAGTYHTCALLTSDVVKCWGNNEYGQLGDGTKWPTPGTTKVSVPGLSGVTAISSGSYHTCALLSSGGVMCWGYNIYGQVGSGGQTYQYVPALVTGLSGVIAISSGTYHTCALLDSGQVKCWGRNNSGQLGDGTTTDRASATSVTGLSGVISISAGSSTTCAVLSSRAVKCWGSNSYGQLGDGTTTDSPSPISATGLSEVGTVAAGGSHTCALLSSGTIKCWGYNAYGQLGAGNTGVYASLVTVTGITEASAISAKLNLTCALLATGDVKCWGNNSYGGLGDGTTTNRSTPTSVVGIS